jgi:hypothetical protein
VRLPPLSDLHRHLDGSLREATLRELAAGLGVDVPAQFRFSPRMGLAAALRCFELSLAVLQAPPPCVAWPTRSAPTPPAKA